MTAIIFGTTLFGTIFWKDLIFKKICFYERNLLSSLEVLGLLIDLSLSVDTRGSQPFESVKSSSVFPAYKKWFISFGLTSWYGLKQLYFKGKVFREDRKLFCEINFTLVNFKFRIIFANVRKKTFANGAEWIRKWSILKYFLWKKKVSKCESSLMLFKRIFVAESVSQNPVRNVLKKNFLIKWEKI